MVDGAEPRVDRDHRAGDPAIRQHTSEMECTRPLPGADLDDHTGTELVHRLLQERMVAAPSLKVEGAELCRRIGEGVTPMPQRGEEVLSSHGLPGFG